MLHALYALRANLVTITLNWITELIRPVSRSDNVTYREITLARGPEGLGFSVVGGRGGPCGDFPIYVKTIFDKGAAADDARLQRGDQIVAVNNTSLQDVTHEEAVQILKNATGTVTLKVISS